MHTFPGYTRRELDDEPLRNYRALLQQAMRIQQDEQRLLTSISAVGTRIGQAEQKDYRAAMRDLWRKRF